MKNFFKYAMMIVAVVMSAVVISSCSKDDDTTTGDGTGIVGKWLFLDAYQEGEEVYMTFNSDGTCILVAEGETDGWTYTLDNGVLTLTRPNTSYLAKYNCTISGSTMKLTRNTGNHDFEGTWQKK